MTDVVQPLTMYAASISKVNLIASEKARRASQELT